MSRSPIRPVQVFVLFLTCLTFYAAPVDPGQGSAPQADSWAPFRFFVGSWEGRGEGGPGVSKGEQAFDLAAPGKEFECYSKGVMKRKKGEPK